MRERGTERANGQQPGRISYTCVCRFAGTRDATRAYIHPAWDTLFHTPPDREARKVEERCPRKFIHYTLQKFLSLKPGQIELRMIELTGKLIFRKRIRFAIYRVSFPLQTLNVRVLIFCVGDKLFFRPSRFKSEKTVLVRNGTNSSTCHFICKSHHPGSDVAGTGPNSYTSKVSLDIPK